VDVTVVVATYGDDSWHRLAWERAIPSAEALGVPVLHAVGASLHDARNFGLGKVRTEWVCVLDADDELEPGYFDHMEQGWATLRAPAVRYIRDGRSRPARMPRVAGHNHDCTADCLVFGNWLVIGTAARTEVVQEVGGFRDFEWSEDWDLWVRCWQDGASIQPVPAAVYRAHVRPDSRNRAPAREVKHAQHQAIARANGLPVPA
jgi:hypothetical protein